MTDEERVEAVLHSVDNQLYLESIAVLAFARGHITIEEYELHRNAHLKDTVYAKDKDGKRMIAILSEDQSYPDDFLPSETLIRSNPNIVIKAIRVANFRRVIKEE